MDRAHLTPILDGPSEYEDATPQEVAAVLAHHARTGKSLPGFEVRNGQVRKVATPEVEPRAAFPPGLGYLAGQIGAWIPPLHQLDIWDEFDATGTVGKGWDASTHAGWIAGIDTLLARELGNGTVVKTDLGASANSVDHVYSYTAGNPEGPTALIVTGIHPEFIGIHSSMRFFEQFVRSEHPAMVELRRRMRVVWISTADPHREYNNANGIQVNRNFDFYWENYVEVGDAPRGPEPFSEPETQILRDVVLSEKPSVVIDCHNLGGRSGDVFEIGSPSSYILSSQSFFQDILAAYNATYNPDGEMEVTRFNPSNPPHYSPYFHNWAAYQQMVHGERRPLSVTLECGVDLFGSTPLTFTSRRAVQAYAGMLHTILTRWLYAGDGAALQPYTYSVSAYRHVDQPTISIQDGGGLMDTQNAVIVPWLGTTPQMGITDNICVPIPYGGALLNVRASGTIQTSRSVADASAGRLEVAILRDGAVEAQSQVYVDFPASTGTLGSPSVTFYTEFTRPFTTPSNKLENKLQLRLDIESGGGGTMTLVKARMVATVSPNMPDYPAIVMRA